MASFGASSADAAAWADFAAAAGLDVVAPTTSPTSPTATAPGVEAEVAGLPTSGLPAEDLEIAAPPTLGEPALVEPTTGEEDIAPPVMGVPSSSEDEEELLADPAGAPLVGAPPVVVDVADVGVQTAHNVLMPAFDMVDVASQTDGKIAFSSFVGDTPQAALAAAIRALSPGSLFRLDGALRQAQAQPLVDVAPSLGGGAEAVPVPPEINLLDDTPVRPPSSSSGVVDPGPGHRRTPGFSWEQQNATAVAEQAALRPLHDDDSDPPATALEAYLQDQDDAARTSSGPSPSGQQPSSSTSPGEKTPFRKAPPPALVLETPEAKVSKAPPLPYPDRPSRSSPGSRRSHRSSGRRCSPSSRPRPPRRPSRRLQHLHRPRRLRLRQWSPRPRPSPLRRRRRRKRPLRRTRPGCWAEPSGRSTCAARRGRDAAATRRRHLRPGPPEPD